MPRLITCIDYMQQTQPHLRIILIGHSEGALIATHIAASRHDFDGIVLLAGCTINCKDGLKKQLHQVVNSLEGVSKWLLKVLPINPAKMQQKFLDKIENSDKHIIRINGLKKFNAGWMRQLLAYTPGDDFPKIRCPILAITGKKDIQVPVEDLSHMQQLANAPIECHAPVNLTHLLREDKQKASISHYKRLIKQPVDRHLLETIHCWIEHL